MKYTYEIIMDELGNEILKRTNEEGVVTWIPLELANSDYQKYLNRDEPAPQL